MTTFDFFGLEAALLRAIKEMRFETPSPIQAQVIPHILQGRDLVALAATGTGKTAAFGLPALHLLATGGHQGLLVIAPTRELAEQVGLELRRFGKYLDLHVVTVYGGQSIGQQITQLRRGANVVVATPGRLLDLYSNGHLEGFQPSIIVIDEADEMFKMGFINDIKEIFSFVPTKRQTLLFSATMTAPIQKLAERIVSQNPVQIKVEQTAESYLDIDQRHYAIRAHEKEEALFRLVDAFTPKKAIIFCNTKRQVDALTMLLSQQGYAAKALHGDMEQPERQKVLRSFRESHTQFLIATDVAARGLDVPDISHVFNFDLPLEQESYVHRIGRTGRAGKKGVALTLLTAGEFRSFQRAFPQPIELSPLPSLQELRGLQQERVIEAIRLQREQQSLESLFETLQKEIPTKELILKLLSLLFNQQPLQGAEFIGLNPHEIQELLRPKKRMQMPAKRGAPSHLRRRRSA